MDTFCSAYKQKNGPTYLFETDDVTLFLFSDCSANIRFQPKYEYPTELIDIVLEQYSHEDGTNKRLMKIYNKIEAAVLETVS
jgi:hypothetical protein